MASHEEPGESISKANVAALRWLLRFMKGKGPHKADVSGSETWGVNIIYLWKLSVGQMERTTAFFFNCQQSEGSLRLFSFVQYLAVSVHPLSEALRLDV